MARLSKRQIAAHNQAIELLDQPKLSDDDRGWVDSLEAYDRTSCQPTDDIYWYRVGCDTCAKYRWQDPKNRGRAPDRSFRIPRKEARL